MSDPNYTSDEERTERLFEVFRRGFEMIRNPEGHADGQILHEIKIPHARRDVVMFCAEDAVDGYPPHLVYQPECYELSDPTYLFVCTGDAIILTVDVDGEGTVDSVIGISDTGLLDRFLRRVLNYFRSHGL